MVLWVRLDTAYFAKNWKHYSKVIFKCVNSAVGPILKFFFFLNKVVDSVNSALCLLPIEMRSIKQKKQKNAWKHQKLKLKRKVDKFYPNAHYMFFFFFNF